MNNTHPQNTGDVQPTVSRKRDHVKLCVEQSVQFRGKTTGFERFDFVHQALPERNFDEIVTSGMFLGKPFLIPLMISCMTGGYPESERINRELAEVCASLQIHMGVGSMRQALESVDLHHTFRAARIAAPSIALVANIGAAEVAQPSLWDSISRLAEIIHADAMTVHLNPLQEALQPEGTPRFRGVLHGIEHFVSHLGIPVIVKEVGAGISGKTALQLLDVGVRYIDVAGAGGTSWAGVEILRTANQHHTSYFWDWGIPTADCLQMLKPLKEHHTFSLIASGGISSGIDIAKSFALGADLAGVARTALQILFDEGQQALANRLTQWQHQLKMVMFLTGASNLQELQAVELRSIAPIGA